MKAGDVVKFDVMVRGRFYVTLRMPVTLDCIGGYVGNEPYLREGAIEEFVKRKCPTLRKGEYKVEFYKR